jgi:hypothetical protein
MVGVTVRCCFDDDYLHTDMSVALGKMSILL